MNEKLKATLDLDISPFKRKAKEVENSGKKIIDTININGKKINVIPKSAEELNNNLKEVEKNSSNATTSLDKGFDKSINKIKKMGLSLLSVRSIYSVISKASSSYLSQDTEMASKLQAVWVGLGSMLAPIIDKIANILITGVKYINTFVKALTGVDLIQKAVAKSTNKANKEAKALNKTLAGFDELTNLNQDSSTSGSTANTDWTKYFEDTTVDTSSIWEKIKEKINDYDWKSLGEKIANFIIDGIKTIFSKDFWKGVWEGISSFADATQEVKNGIDLAIEEAFGIKDGKPKTKGKAIIKGIVEGITETINLFINPFYAIIELFKTIFGIHSPSTVFEGFGKNIIQGLVNGLTNAKQKIVDAWNKVKSWFTDIKKNASVSISQKWSDLKTTWENLTKNFKDIKIKITANIDDFKKKIKNVISNNTVLSTVFNWSKDKISQVKNWVNSLDVGTNYVPNDQLALIHKGEAVVPKKFNNEQYFSRFGNNEEVINAINNLNQTLINKDMNLEISYKEVGQASTKYINEANRIQGKSVINI